MAQAQRSNEGVRRGQTLQAPFVTKRMRTEGISCVMAVGAVRSGKDAYGVA